MGRCMDEWTDRQFGQPNTILSIKDAHYARADLWRWLGGQVCKAGKGRPMGRVPGVTHAPSPHGSGITADMRKQESKLLLVQVTRVSGESVGHLQRDCIHLRSCFHLTLSRHWEWRSSRDPAPRTQRIQTQML